MKKLRTLIILALSTVSFTACVIGPLATFETAQTVGEKKAEFIGGGGTPGTIFKATIGLTDRIDIGFQWESLSIGYRAKYRISPDLDGLIFAGAVGLGSNFGGSYQYFDLLSSKKFQTFEPYANLRLVRGKTDPVEFKNRDTGTTTWTVQSAEFNYGQFFLGSRVWLNEKWFGAIEISDLFPINSISFDHAAVYSLGMGGRF